MTPPIPHPQPKALVALALVLLLGVGCATTHLPPISREGGSFEPEPDEIRLWTDARAEEKKLAQTAVFYDDPLLEDYMEDVVHRLQTPGMAANPEIRYRVRVVEDPSLNAFAYPHGSIYVHTGLLARMENEDQLATVLGHEMSHVEQRHMVRYRRNIQNKQIAWSAAALVAAVVLAGEEADAWADGDWAEAARIGILTDVLVGLGLQLAVLASVNGYGRDLEREADHGAFQRLARAGYDLRQSPRVYELLQQERGDDSGVEVFFFGNHPRLANRVQAAESWLAENPAALEVAENEPTVSDRFLRRLRPVWRDDAALNIEIGRFDLAEKQLFRAFELMPEDPRLHYIYSHLYRARAEQEPERAAVWLHSARSALRESIRLEPDRPLPHRDLGLLAWDEGDLETACRELGFYLELDPDADDADRMRDYLLELEDDGACVP